ncbi:arabinosyltransferase domain-containing protein, partial [Nocardia thailandica]
MRADSTGPARLRLIAAFSGVLGVLLAVATPFLPVRQHAVSLDWPQPQSLQLTAPLVHYAPLSLDVTVPCATLREIPGGTVVSTVPPQAPGAAEQGLVVRVDDRAQAGRTLVVSLRGAAVLTAPLAETVGAPTGAVPGPGGPPPGTPQPPSGAARPAGPAETPAGGSAAAPADPGAGQAGSPACGLTVRSTTDRTVAELTGATRPDGSPYRAAVEGDQRPQVVGVYTDLDRGHIGEARLHAAIDTRFATSPSGWKLAAIAGAVLCAVVASTCLFLLDRADRKRTLRLLPVGWWRPRGTDAVVAFVLLLWYVVGANTSDDGYILTMARSSHEAGYTANFYRWFQVAEAPFGWPYELIAQMSKLGEASLWLRLPSLLTGLLCWLVLSRAVLPRLGARVGLRALTRWAAALMFLAVWLPFDNGLRPEPIIALGVLLTWCAMERAVATRRILPAALAALIASFALAAGPSGLICLAPLLAGARHVWRAVVDRAERTLGPEWTSAARVTGSGTSAAGEPAGTRAPFVRRMLLCLLGFGASLAPIAAAGTLVLVVVYADQTWATVAEAVRVRQLIGPDLTWSDEPTRWESLISLTPDGSLSRRFGILAMLLCLVVCVLIALRRGGRIPFTARGPVARLLAVVVMSLLLMAFTPTKWTHHLGVYAGLAAALAAVTALAVSPAVTRPRYYRTAFGAAVLALLAYCCTGSNGWWYVSGYGVTWPDRAPALGDVPVSTILLLAAGLCALVAGWQYLTAPQRDPDDPARAAVGPSTLPPHARGVRTLAPRRPVNALVVAAAAMVVFQVVSQLTAAWSQYPAYSVALGNLRSLGGDACALGDDVLVERDTADSLLLPVTGSAADGLSAENTGFTPNGVGSLAPDPGPAGMQSGPPSGSGPGGSAPNGGGAPGGSGPNGGGAPGGSSPNNGGAPSGSPAPGGTGAPGGASAPNGTGTQSGAPTPGSGAPAGATGPGTPGGTAAPGTGGTPGGAAAPGGSAPPGGSAAPGG